MDIRRFLCSHKFRGSRKYRTAKKTRLLQSNRAICAHGIKHKLTKFLWVSEQQI